MDFTKEKMMEQHNYTNIIQPCDIFFTFRKTNFFSKLISKFSWLGVKPTKEKDYTSISHCGIYIGDGKFAEMGLKGLYIDINPIFNKDEFGFYIGRIVPNLNFDKDAMIKSIIDENASGKTKYSYLQMVLLFFKKVIGILKWVGNPDKDATCSEKVSLKFSERGVAVVPGMNYCDISPIDIYLSDFVEIIYDNE
jgi:hypothetical protein